MKIYGVKIQVDGSLDIEAEEVLKETKHQYMVPGQLSSYGYRLKIDKSKAHLTAQAAVEGFVREQKDKIACHQHEIMRLEALIAAARQLHA